jgi:hypothetical protein
MDLVPSWILLYYVQFFLFLNLHFFVVLAMKPRAWCMLGNYSATRVIAIDLLPFFFVVLDFELGAS